MYIVSTLPATSWPAPQEALDKAKEVEEEQPKFVAPKSKLDIKNSREWYGLFAENDPCTDL